jgi:hypothetical protein
LLVDCTSAEEVLEILLNKDLIAINQDTLGVPAKPLLKSERRDDYMDVCATAAAATTAAATATATATAATTADEEKNVGVEGNSPTVLLWCVMNLPIQLSTKTID